MESHVDDNNDSVDSNMPELIKQEYDECKDDDSSVDTYVKEDVEARICDPNLKNKCMPHIGQELQGLEFEWDLALNTGATFTSIRNM